MTYPIIKIPPLIAKVKPQNKELVPRNNIDSREGRKLRSVLKYPRAVKITLNIGYTLLLAAALVFILAVVHNSQWLAYSLFICLPGLVGINISSLIADRKILVPVSDLHLNNRINQISTTTEFIPIDWDLILKDNVMPHGKVATAQAGVSEAYFESYLKRYFGDIIHPGYQFKIDENYSYSSDFTMILPNRLSFIIEIDEPYEGKTGSPHHCTDNNKDTNRDLFFLNGNWIVIRFSEFQVCAHPIECCYTIAKTIDRLNYSNDYSTQFRGIGMLPLDRQWTSHEAAAMAKKKYRLDYLSKYNIYHDRQSSRRSK